MQITIEQLCKKLETELLKISCLETFYIGKADDLDRREKEHENEGYSSTTGLAKGSPSVISEAEESLISYFQNSGIADKLNNASPYSVGNDEANIIYVSLIISPQDINELDDDDIDWPEIYELI